MEAAEASLVMMVLEEDGSLWAGVRVASCVGKKRRAGRDFEVRGRCCEEGGEEGRGRALEEERRAWRARLLTKPRPRCRARRAPELQVLTSQTFSQSAPLSGIRIPHIPPAPRTALPHSPSSPLPNCTITSSIPPVRSSPPPRPPSCNFHPARRPRTLALCPLPAQLVHPLFPRHAHPALDTIPFFYCIIYPLATAANGQQGQPLDSALQVGSHDPRILASTPTDPQPPQ